MGVLKNTLVLILQGKEGNQTKMKYMEHAAVGASGKPSCHLRPETHGLKATKYDASRSLWTSHQTCLKAFLTLIATMHSMVLSLRTQEMAGATASSRLHFWYSASDLRHHLILAEGAAEVAAVKSREQSCSAFRAKHKPACVTVRTEAPAQHREEESLHTGCPGVQVSRADRAGGRGFYSTPPTPPTFALVS